MELRDGDVERVVPGVLEVQEVPVLPPHRELLQAPVLGDAVVDVHHVVAHLEICEGAERQGFLRPGAPPQHRVGAEDLLLGDQGELELGDPEPRRQLADPEADPPRLRQLPPQASPQVVVPQDLGEPSALRLAPRDQDHPLASASPAIQILQEAGDAPAVALDADGRDLTQEGGRRRFPGGRLARRGRERRECDPGPRLRLPAEIVPGHPAIGRRREEGCHIGLPVGLGLRVPEERRRPLGQGRILVPDDQRRRGQIGKHGGGVGHQVRQEGIPLGDGPSLLQGFQPGRRNRDAFPPSRGPEARLHPAGRVLGHQELLQGKQGRLGGGAQGALGLRVEVAEGVDLVPEELHAHGMPHGRGKAIQDPATDRELPRLRHLADAAVASGRQGAQQLLPGHDPLGVERHHRALQRSRRDGAG